MMLDAAHNQQKTSEMRPTQSRYLVLYKFIFVPIIPLSLTFCMTELTKCVFRVSSNLFVDVKVARVTLFAG